MGLERGPLSLVITTVNCNRAALNSVCLCLSECGNVITKLVIIVMPLVSPPSIKVSLYTPFDVYDVKMKGGFQGT
jgi:hypothetical protein